jgi:hypothetical protein
MINFFRKYFNKNKEEEIKEEVKENNNLSEEKEMAIRPDLQSMINRIVSNSNSLRDGDYNAAGADYLARQGAHLPMADKQVIRNELIRLMEEKEGK